MGNSEANEEVNVLLAFHLGRRAYRLVSIPYDGRQLEPRSKRQERKEMWEGGMDLKTYADTEGNKRSYHEVNLRKIAVSLDFCETVFRDCFRYVPNEIVDAEALPSGVPSSCRVANPWGKVYDRSMVSSLSGFFAICCKVVTHSSHSDWLSEYSIRFDASSDKPMLHCDVMSMNAFS